MNSPSLLGPKTPKRISSPREKILFPSDKRKVETPRAPQRRKKKRRRKKAELEKVITKEEKIEEELASKLAVPILSVEEVLTNKGFEIISKVLLRKGDKIEAGYFKTWTPSTEICYVKLDTMGDVSARSVDLIRDVNKYDNPLKMEETEIYSICKNIVPGVMFESGSTLVSNITNRNGDKDIEVMTLEEPEDTDSELISSFPIISYKYITLHPIKAMDNVSICYSKLRYANSTLCTNTANKIIEIGEECHYVLSDFSENVFSALNDIHDSIASLRSDIEYLEDPTVKTGTKIEKYSLIRNMRKCLRQREEKFDKLIKYCDAIFISSATIRNAVEEINKISETVKYNFSGLNDVEIVDI